jgi:hypothetical protein
VNAAIVLLMNECGSYLQGKSVRVIQLCAGVDERLDALLSRPNCDCVLVTDLHMVSQQWLDSLTWRIKDASHSGIQ